MAQYFMQLRGGNEELLDPDGLEFPNLAALRDAVLLTARDLIATDARLGIMDFRLRIDAEDEGGVIVHTLCFKHAVDILTGVPSLFFREAGKHRESTTLRSE